MFEYEADKDKNEKSQAMTTGQFIFVKDNESENGVLILKDDQQNLYELNTVSLRTDEFSDDAGSINLPKPFVTDKTGEIIEAGAKVLIAFPRGKKNPVVMGCLNSLGGQYMNTYDLRIDLNNMRDCSRYRQIGNTYIKSVESSSGYSMYITEGGYNISAGRNVVLSSEESVILTGMKNLNAGGKTVNIKGNSSIEKEDKKQQRLNDKADDINIYGKKVSIGHSNDIGAVYEVDKESDYLKPRYQNIVMGITLKVLFDKLIDELTNAIWVGSGTVRMSPTSKMQLKIKVKQNTQKILSKVGFVLYDSNQVEDDNNTGGVS